MSLKDIYKQFGGAKLLFPLAGILILLFAGVSIFFTPSYEVMYNHHLLPVVNSKEGTLYIHAAVAMMREVFTVIPRKWRGIGEIDRSGLALSRSYENYDAERRFAVSEIRTEEPADCISGLVLQGRAKPTDCPAFARRCTPDTPLGATMVSSEGACAAYYRYRRNESCPASSD